MEDLIEFIQKNWLQLLAIIVFPVGFIVKICIWIFGNEKKQIEKNQIKVEQELKETITKKDLKSLQENLKLTFQNMLLEFKLELKEEFKEPLEARITKVEQALDSGAMQIIKDALKQANELLINVKNQNA